MSTIKTYPMGNSAILRINAEKDSFVLNPEYQRYGEIWNLEKKQLLIDSIINDYDIPKLYFHVLPKENKYSNNIEKVYAIIDGRQRLEAIWSFIEGNFALSPDFIFFGDKKVQAGNLTYGDLAKKYPKLKINFDSFTLPIILVEIDDMDVIEEMFSRLNEAVPLNAAEKRNAFGGPMAKVIRIVANHKFFKHKVPIKNNRYQHREIAARLLFLIFCSDKIIDTKKVYLDSFVKSYKPKLQISPSATTLEKSVVAILDLMSNIFVHKDALLRSQSIVPIYFLLFMRAREQSKLDFITRIKLQDFRGELVDNRKIAEKDITKANFEYLEFERLSQQGTNDAASIKERLNILSEYVDIKRSDV